MDETILKAIDDELARLVTVRAILAGGEAPARKERQRRELSPEARQAIVEAQHKRWAKVHAAHAVPVLKPGSAAG